jgi:1-phosphatidylinositol-3-phosphate 5-kinase
MVDFERKLVSNELDSDQLIQIREAVQEAGNMFSDALLDGEIASFRLVGDFPAEIKLGLNYLVEHSQAIISPFTHQKIMVLYSNFCTVTGTPCHPPEIHVVEFYRETDMTLGQFLEELCFDSSYICPALDCQRSMLQHCRTYVHGNAQISVLVEEFPSPISGMEQTILMWSLCK